MVPVRVGAHVDQADPIRLVRERGGDIAQFFLGDPQAWKGPKVAYAGGADALRAAARDADVDIYIHAPYVLNVASTNNRIRIPSRKYLQQHLDAAARVGASGLIVHGGHVTRDDDPELGFENWRKCVERLELRCPLLIENTAGGDHAMARHLDRLGRLWEAITTVAGGEEVGFCLDTCHAHAAGEDLVGLVDRVKALTGRIDLVHANSSRDEPGSGADRHANLATGRIDREAILDVVRAAGVSVLVETPAEGQSDDIAWLRAQLGG